MSTYYPIGTIVNLDISDVQFMIAGYLPKREDSGIFDYFAVPFPFGFTDEKKYICFNHSAIKEVVFEGYRDEECEEVLNGFDELVSNFNRLVNADTN